LAEAVDRKFEEELLRQRHGIVAYRPEMKFGELTALFCASGCFKDWHNERLKLLLPFFTEMPITAISKKLVRDYRHKRIAGKAITEATVNRDLQCLRRILYWAVEERFISENPLASLHLERERRKKRPILSVAEEERLLACSAPHLKKLIVGALNTGMRRGELFRQLAEDVHIETNVLYVSHSKTPEGEAREIPLTAELRKLLAQLNVAKGPLFTFGGKPHRQIKTAWHGAIRRAGIRYIPFHYLRHTYNVRLMEAGVAREIRMALLGHSFGDVHENYEHIELPAKREAVRKLEAWLALERERLAAEKEEQQKGGETNESRPAAD